MTALLRLLELHQQAVTLLQNGSYADAIQLYTTELSSNSTVDAGSTSPTRNDVERIPETLIPSTSSSNVVLTSSSPLPVVVGSMEQHILALLEATSPQLENASFVPSPINETVTNALIRELLPRLPLQSISINEGEPMPQQEVHDPSGFVESPAEPMSLREAQIDFSVHSSGTIASLSSRPDRPHVHGTEVENVTMEDRGTTDTQTSAQFRIFGGGIYAHITSTTNAYLDAWLWCMLQLRTIQWYNLGLAYHLQAVSIGDGNGPEPTNIARALSYYQSALSCLAQTIRLHVYCDALDLLFLAVHNNISHCHHCLNNAEAARSYYLRMVGVFYWSQGIDLLSGEEYDFFHERVLLAPELL